MNFKNFTADFYADIGEKFAGKRNISAKIIFKTGLKIKYNFNSTFQMKQLLRVNTAHAAKVKIQLYIHTFRAERCGIAISDSQENIHAGLTNLHLSNLPALEKKKKKNSNTNDNFYFSLEESAFLLFSGSGCCWF